MRDEHDGLPMDPRLDWRTRLPVLGAPPPTHQPPVPLPVDAPPPPQQLRAPHNLFTLAEVVEALDLLGQGLRRPQDVRVMVTHTNGASPFMATDDLARINYLTDVVKVSVSWTYPDGSSVTGTLVDRPGPGRLAVEGAGQALAAAQQCLEHLKKLRPGQASVRGWFAGHGLEGLYLLLGAVVFVTYLITVDGAAAGLRPPTTSTGLVALAVLLILGLGLSRALSWLFAWLRRRVGGTRLALASQAHRTLLSNELGVLATTVGAAASLLTLVVAIVAL